MVAAKPTGTYATPAEALAAAIVLAGGQAAFARLIGLAQPSVWRWVKQGKSLPAEYVEAVSLATKIPMKDLRPDLPFEDEATPPLPGLSTTEEAAR